MGVVSKNYFQGLPSPAAAALVCGFVWLGVEGKLPEWLLPYQSEIAAVVTLYAGLTMVSNAPFFSGQELRRRAHDPVLVRRGVRASLHRDLEQHLALRLRPLLHLRPLGLRLRLLLLVEPAVRTRSADIAAALAAEAEEHEDTQH